MSAIIRTVLPILVLLLSLQSRADQELEYRKQSLRSMEVWIEFLEKRAAQSQSEIERWENQHRLPVPFSWA